MLAADFAAFDRVSLPCTLIFCYGFVEYKYGWIAWYSLPLGFLDN